MTRSVDLKAIGCDSNQGSNTTEVFVSKDGGTVYLHCMNDIDKLLVYSVRDNRMIKTDDRAINDRYTTDCFPEGKILPGMPDVIFGQIALNVYAYLFYGKSPDAYVDDLQAVIFREKEHRETCYNLFK